MRLSLSRAFELLSSRSSEVITLLDGEGRALYQSPSILGVLGYTADELLGRNLFDLVHPDDRLRAQAEMAAHQQSPQAATRSELRMRHKDGSWRDLEILGLNALDEPELRCMVSLARDITDRKRVERDLRRAETHLRALVGGLPLIAYAIDMEGRFTYSDGGALAKLGVEPGAAVGKDAFKMYGEIKAFTDALRAGLDGESVRYVSEAAGAVFDNLHTPYFDETGRQIGVVGLAIDITDRARLESELAQTQRLDAIGRLAGGLAHDFNNLLTVILGNALSAREGVPSTSESAQAMTDVIHAAEHAQRLTQQLLAFARRQPVHPRVIDVTELVANAANMLRRTVGSNRTFHLQLESAGTWVLADPGQLEQVIVNLVLNARDAMPTGGTLAIRTRIEDATSDQRPVDLPQPLAGSTLVVLEVADTGHGMAADILEHIFEPFFTTKAPGEGTGLGLPSALGIVRQAGGDLRVESVVGQGSTFRIYLPISPPGDATPPASRSEASEPSTGGETLLLVEDNTVVGDVAAAALVRAGYTVVRAGDGLEALDRLGEQSFDLVITDLAMPRMGGRELGERIAETQPDLPVLFVSAYATDAQSMGLGPRQRFLAKPFRPNQLREAVRALLDAAGRSTASSAPDR